jgi:hypothetical protein
MMTEYDDRRRTAPDPRSKRIAWARGMENEEIATVLQNELMKARAENSTSVSLLMELVHEIKHRLKATDYDTSRRSRDD